MTGGYRADPAALTQAAKSLSEVPAHALEQPLAAVKDIQITAADFGRAHQASGAPYLDGVRRLAGTAESYLKAAKDFAGKLNSAGGQYQATEDAGAAKAGEYK